MNTNQLDLIQKISAVELRNASGILAQLLEEEPETIANLLEWEASPTEIESALSFAVHCRQIGLDLSDAGVLALRKERGFEVSDGGLLLPLIGRQTAAAYLEVLLERASIAPSAAAASGTVRHLTSQGVALVKEFEGLERKIGNSRVQTYRDAVGVLTIGYGHTDSDTTPGKTITFAEAEQLLNQDLQQAGADVLQRVTVPLNDNQYSALVSFVFNLGAGAFGGSTMLRLLNGGKYQEAADQFPRWVFGKINGERQRLAGLIRRRAAERQLFLN